jgi:hypothetical protein
MIFPIEQVKGGIDRIYEVPLVFFENAKLAYTCHSKILPYWFRPVYKRCPGVKERFSKLFLEYKKLNKRKQNQIINLIRSSRELNNICGSKTIIYPGLDKLDSKIHRTLASLYDFLFRETIGTDIFRQQTGMHIDDHYAAFSTLNNIHVCPFCGLESYTLPEIRRAEYDHYLPISIYPWLGINLNNLVPMGDHCNGKKNATNVLYSNYSNSTRRAVWYPYEWINYTLKLNAINIPSLSNMSGKWDVQIIATERENEDKIETWNEIFQVKDRFNGTISTFHKKFIEDFIKKNSLYEQRLTVTSLKAELLKYKNNGIGDERIETMAKLKYIWADYYINVPDKSQLALISHMVSITKQKESLLPY